MAAVTSSQAQDRASFNIWSPFVRFGSRGDTVNWLLPKLAPMRDNLNLSLSAKFRAQCIPAANITYQVFNGQGISAERRPFYTIQQGLTTVIVFVGAFGDDLYISQTLFIKRPIAPARIVFLLALLGIVVIPIFMILSGFGSVMSSYGGSSSASLLLGAFCLICGFPLSFPVVMLGALYTVLRFFIDRDYLFLLRGGVSDFQQDDIVALQKAVEHTVRTALSELELSSVFGTAPPAPETLMPEKEYSARIRLF